MALLPTKVDNTAASALKERYDKLLQMRQQTDPEGIIYPDGWLQLHQSISQFSLPPAPPTTAHTTYRRLLAQVNGMEQYLKAFEQYKKVVKPFFAAYSGNENLPNFRQRHLYLTIQNLARCLFNHFKQGVGITAGINADVELLAAKIDTFTQLQKQAAYTAPKPATPLGQLPIFAPLGQNYSFQNLTLYVQTQTQNLTSGNIFTQQRLSQIAKGYFDLKAQEVEHLFRHKPYLFSPYLADLKNALQNNQHNRINDLLTQMSRLIPPTRITQPASGTTSRNKVLPIEGNALPNSRLLLRLNNQHTYSTTTNPQGVFIFEKVELTEGVNTLICYNPQYRFLYTSIPEHLLYFIHTLPYAGRIDSVTQQPLEQQNIQQIVRCAKCKNYMLNFSVAENDGICPIFKCSSKQFYTNDQQEFWMA